MRGEIVILLGILLIASATATGCELQVSLVNQDPYPAVPGDYVKLVFQIDGIQSNECGDVTFDLPEQYPVSFNPGEETPVTIKAGTYTKDYSSFLMVPYKVRVDEDALDGDNPIEVTYSYSKEGTGALHSEQFDLNVEDTRAEFEVFVKDYSTSSKELTLEVLNFGEADIEALTVTIPKQDSIEVKGANRVIVGDLDSNEYTSADFEATPSGEPFVVELTYTDSINVRRSTEFSVSFDEEYFTGRVADQKETSIWSYIFWIVIIGGIGYWFFKRKKKK